MLLFMVCRLPRIFGRSFSVPWRRPLSGLLCLQCIGKNRGGWIGSYAKRTVRAEERYLPSD
ncbi:hypothetical protein [Peribacillus butanolivorans]|uniref:hypothetical protein n=1 Tax=Peribacillus butanolivorans TaxID=421767 RepID=UPI00380E9EAD